MMGFSLYLICCLIQGDPASQSEIAEVDTLTTARAIRLLTPERASLGLPVRIEGVITFFDSGETVFLQDETGGSFYQGLKRDPRWRLGQRVRVTGRTSPGLYVPGIKATRAEVLGPGIPPEPITVTAETLASGRFHYQWVEMDGIGRSITATGENTSVLRMASGSHPVEILIDEAPPGETLNLVDARLKVLGLAAGYINDRRQLVGPHLKVSSYRDVIVLEPSPNPEELSRVSFDEFLRFAPNGRSDRRVKVEGVVLGQCPGGPLFVREKERGLLVESRQVDRFQPGDVVEVLGFPAMGTFRAYLADATLRRVGEQDPPAPRPSTTKNLLTGLHDADLVELEGELAASDTSVNEAVLTIQSDEATFRVRGVPGPLPPWPRGSRLAVRGICRIAGTTDQGYRVRPASFELWARSLEDIRVLQAPSWWTPQRLTAAVAALASAILAALVWVYLLRRRIREQTSIIRSQLAREIVLDERQRIAREVHDTLEQEMVGLALRLDAALSVADPRVSTILDSTRPLISRIQGELRSLVWDLREQAEGPHNLTAALEQTARELQAETTSTLQFQLKGVPWSLPGSVGHDLLRIARETIANALKHANPSTIKVELSYAPNHLTLSVQDDGQGFELNNPSLARPGHFGLIGIQERARKMGAGLQLKSKAGEGTLIEVRVGRTLGLPGDSLHDEP